MNSVVVGNGKQVLKTVHFDTYAEGSPINIFFTIILNYLKIKYKIKIKDSTNLEIYLEGLVDNTILIAVTFDEASYRYFISNYMIVLL